MSRSRGTLAKRRDKGAGAKLLVSMEDPEASPALDGRMAAPPPDCRSEWEPLKGLSRLSLKELKATV